MSSLHVSDLAALTIYYAWEDACDMIMCLVCVRTSVVAAIVPCACTLYAGHYYNTILIKHS